MKEKSAEPFVREVVLLRDRVENWQRYPFSIPAVRNLESLTLHPQVTFLVGENGTGKSTLIEAIAVAAGFNPEGGNKNLRFATLPSESELHRYLRLLRGARRPKRGFFLRADIFFNLAIAVERDPLILNTYGRFPHQERSLGQTFLALVKERFGPDGLYILDEPEAALSPQHQIEFLAAFDRMARTDRCQIVVATHYPILLAYPHARIYVLSEEGAVETEYRRTEHFALTRDFLTHRERYLRHLLDEA